MNSKEKGNRGERELANYLSSKGFSCRRGVQYRGSPESPDVVGLDGIHIECKRVEKLNTDNAMLQAEHDSGENEIPVVIHRKNRHGWKVTMRLDDWLEFYERWRHDCMGSEKTNDTIL